VRIWPRMDRGSDGEYSDGSTWIGLARNTYAQVLGSVAVACLVCGFYWSKTGSLFSTPFADLTAFHAFVFGVATVFAIVGPILFAFLMQELQSCREERADVYWKLNEAVAAVRERVAAMSPDGKIHYRLADRLRDIEILRLDKIDSLHEIHRLFGSVHNILRWVQRKSIGKRPNEKEMALACALNRVEERLSMLGINFIRRICVAVLKDSVMKCMWCVGALVLVSVLALGFYSFRTQSSFLFLATALSAFGIFITLELATLAAQEVREVAPSVSEDEDLLDEEFEDAREAG
jgi:hypothetical protein